jgi:hypothetical protein
MVRAVQAIEHEGLPTQRLTIDFAARGRVVLNAAVAPLIRSEDESNLRFNDFAGEQAGLSSDAAGLFRGERGENEIPRKESGKENQMSRLMSQPSSAAGRKGWLDELEQSSGGSHELWALPDALKDPFASPAQRLRATLETYKFSTEPRALLDWARVQTRLDDPLTKYTRQELEQAFPRFARDRDQHLRTMIKELKRKGDQASIKAAMKGGLVPQAQSALDKALRS